MQHWTVRRVSDTARSGWKEQVDPVADEATIEWQMRGFLLGSRIICFLPADLTDARAGGASALLRSRRFPGVYLVVSHERVVIRVLTQPSRVGGHPNRRSRQELRTLARPPLKTIRGNSNGRRVGIYGSARRRADSSGEAA